jgi:alkylation response protein AidB-like acyl-CoA dehydrogenase
MDEEKRRLRFDLSDDQELFRSTAVRFLQREFPRSRIRQIADGSANRFDKNMWSQCAELGWAAMFGPQALGGGSISGNAIEDIAIIAEEAGRVLAPLPILGVNLAVLALTGETGGQDAETILRPLMEGKITAAWAYEEPEGRWHPSDLATTVEVDGDGVVVTGRKTLVQYGADVDYFLVTGRTGLGLTQLLIPSDCQRVSVRRLRSLDLLHEYAQVDFAGTQVPMSSVVGKIGGAGGQVATQFQACAALQCAETVGGLQEVFDLTVEYARSRYAFGRPIGSFQALKHRIADMLSWLESCNGAAEAVASQTEEDKAAMTTSAAMAYIGMYGPQILQDCTQIHGGIGLTWDHDLHLYLRRATSNRGILGTPDQHKEWLCAHLEDLYGAAS